MLSFNALSYESTKIVLQYMEANTRFRISQNCPALRHTERIVPLKIKFLRMTDNHDVKINDHKYTLGIYRNYPKDAPIPKYQRRENQRGGVFYDLDEYGIDKNFREEAFDEAVERKQTRIRELEVEITKRPKWDLGYVFEELERLQTEIQELTNRRQGILPLYTLLLQFTISKHNKLLVEKRFDYTLDIVTASQKLFNLLFADRRGPIFVQHWDLQTAKKSK